MNASHTAEDDNQLAENVSFTQNAIDQQMPLVVIYFTSTFLPQEEHSEKEPKPSVWCVWNCAAFVRLTFLSCLFCFVFIFLGAPCSLNIHKRLSCSESRLFYESWTRAFVLVTPELWVLSHCHQSLTMKQYSRIYKMKIVNIYISSVGQKEHENFIPKMHENWWETNHVYHRANPSIYM